MYTKPQSVIRLRKGLSEIKIIDFSKIIYCRAEGNYTRIYLKNENFLVSKVLKYFESGLPCGMFLRIHRSLLINIMSIVGLYENSVILSTNVILNIARRRKKKIFKVLSKDKLIVKIGNP